MLGFVVPHMVYIVRNSRAEFLLCATAKRLAAVAGRAWSHRVKTMNGG